MRESFVLWAGTWHKVRCIYIIVCIYFEKKNSLTDLTMQIGNKYSNLQYINNSKQRKHVLCPYKVNLKEKIYII